MRERESKPQNPLPKTAPAELLDGAVCAQYKRCGKPNCRCARGELHGPYFYRFRWRGGRVVKEYVPLSRVEEVRAACARRRQKRADARAARARLWGMIRKLEETFKEFGYE
jgi:hypothetical protein